MNFADVVDDAALTVEMAANAEASIAGADPVPVLFDRPGASLMGNVDATGPVAIVAAALAPGLARGVTVDIDSEHFLVKGVQPDGHGLVTIALELSP